MDVLWSRFEGRINEFVKWNLNISTELIMITKENILLFLKKKSTLTFRMHGQMRDADRKKGMVEHIRFHSTISIGN